MHSKPSFAGRARQGRSEIGGAARQLSQCAGWSAVRYLRGTQCALEPVSGERARPELVARCAVLVTGQAA